MTRAPQWRGRPLALEEFREFVQRPHGASDCWNWTHCRRDGYGVVWVARRKVLAHRLSYETLVGAIPAGFHLDHLCRNPSCINPAHLEPVTHRENVLRGVSPSASNARKALCKMGHSLDGPSAFVDANGSRQCRVCHNARQRAYNARKRAAA